MFLFICASASSVHFYQLLNDYAAELRRHSHHSLDVHVGHDLPTVVKTLIKRTCALDAAGHALTRPDIFTEALLIARKENAFNIYA